MRPPWLDYPVVLWPLAAIRGNINGATETIRERPVTAGISFAKSAALALSQASSFGVLSGLAGATAVGTADCVLTLLRAPADARAAVSLLSMLFRCVAVTLPLGLCVGVAQELVLRAASRRTSIRAGFRFLANGPADWLPPNEVVARRVFGGVAFAGVAVALLLAVLGRLASAGRDPRLLALAATLSVIAVLVVAALVTVVLAWPMDWALARFRTIRSPAVAGLTATLLVSAPIALALRWYQSAFAIFVELKWFLVLSAAGVFVDLVVFAWLVSRPHEGVGRARGLISLGGTALALAVIAVAGARLGRDQASFSTILQHSAVVRHLIGPLERVVDRDHDGFGRWFGGGDCDDTNAGVHPGALDLPENGLDENCSGNDARRASHQAAIDSAKGAPKFEGAASILFLSIDAVRPDHTSLHGYGRPTTPNLARFAERATRFTSAYATSTQSVRSLISIFTGRHASSLEWKPDSRLPELALSNLTLAERLRAGGHRTAAFLNTPYFSETTGFFQGFELVQEGALSKDDEAATLGRAVAWLAERSRLDERFFAWIHLINPHAPYRDSPSTRDFGTNDLDRYDEEIARTDAALVPLFSTLDALEQKGKPVLVAVFSDHGEAFGEHGRRFHGNDLHEGVARVLLLVRAPGAPTAELGALVSLLDLHATALHFAGLPTASGPSRSLAAAILAPATCGDRPACFRESARVAVDPTHGSNALLRAIVAPPWKLIHDVQHGAWELYDLRADPLEHRNAYDRVPDRAAELRARLLDADPSDD